VCSDGILKILRRFEFKNSGVAGNSAKESQRGDGKDNL
jgi:hypothetical protein